MIKTKESTIEKPISILGEWVSDGGVSYTFYENGKAFEKGPFAQIKRTYEINGAELCIKDVEIKDAVTCSDYKIDGDELTWFGVTYKKKK